MKNLHHRKSFKTFAVTIGIVCVVGIVCFFCYPFLSSGVNTLTNGLSQVSANVSENINKSSYDELLEENKRLSEENAKLREQAADYYDLQEENERLWKFYDIKKENPTYTYVPSTVIRRDSNADFYSFTIDAGTSLGISVNDPVVTENGLVGIVTECDISSSKVKTILSPEIKIGAIDSKTKDSGVISGSSRYCDDNLTMLTKISSENKISKGDIIKTSGVGGLFPADIIIGQVKEFSYDDYDASKFTVVEPYEDVRKVSSVLVITDFTTKGQVSLEKSNDTDKDNITKKEETSPTEETTYETTAEPSAE